ncbi:MAG: site-specific integrase [Nocardioidaceae bacterium]|nr:site-specific integrase [Nocardioidaceae bacterium]
MAEGIEIRTSKKGRKSFRASVWSARDEKLIRKTFPTLAAAKSWRRAALTELERGQLRPPDPQTISEAAEEFLDGARKGSVRDRSGRGYKPSTIRGYERALNLRVLPALGSVRLTELRRGQVQALVDRMAENGNSGSTIRNTLDPLRAIYRRAMSRELVGVNPTSHLELPSAKSKRDRIAGPDEAGKLLAALPQSDRALWATAFYAGLRRGELRALRVEDIDLGKSEIHVRRSWDAVEGDIDPKSEAGTRIVPLLAVLRDFLDAHLMKTRREGSDLVFGRETDLPFIPSTVRNRALDAWGEGELDPIGLHECRHTFASLLIDAGANPKAIQEFMGHATIQMTFDRYGHLMPGRRDEIRASVDLYLERPSEASDEEPSPLSPRM